MFMGLNYISPPPACEAHPGNMGLNVLDINDEPAFTFYDPYTFGGTPVFLAAAFTMSPVPEPSLVVMLAIGGILCGFWWRRKLKVS